MQNHPADQEPRRVLGSFFAPKSQNTPTWEQRKLGEIAKEVVRNDPASDAPIMMITAGNGFIEQSDRYAFNNAGESLKKYILLERGELAYNHGASKLRPYGSCFALTTVEKARIPFVYHCFSVEKSNPEFLSIELNGANVENQLRKIVSSGARMDGLLNIAYSEYTEVTVQLPKKEEQDWIAKFFKHLDTLITLHQRKYEKLVNIKKSMLDKMFPKNGASVPEIRFKGFTDPWEQRKLGDITVELSEYATQELGLPLLTSSRSGLMYQDEYRDSRTTKSTETLFSVVPVGTCTYRHMSDDDVFHMNINTLEKGLVSREYPVFEASKGNNLEFLVQHINSSEEFKAFCAEQKKGGTRTRLYYNTLCQFTVRVPALKEQAQISQCLKKLDTLITLHQRKLEKLQNIKKSCLEKMFV